MAAGATGATPATGTTLGAAAATAGLTGFVAVATGETAGAAGECADADTPPADAVAGDVGVGTDSNTGAAATLEPAACTGAATLDGVTARLPGGASVRRWPGQIVYGSAIPFHWARSRKSTPLRNAIE
jgi:hypothetical protein